MLQTMLSIEPDVNQNTAIERDTVHNLRDTKVAESNFDGYTELLPNAWYPCLQL